jgi:hypothetical protein
VTGDLEFKKIEHLVGIDWIRSPLLKLIFS